MEINVFSKHIFWSYNKEADLPPELIIKNVLAFGEIPDLILLAEKLSADLIHEVITKWKNKKKFSKRINFMEKVILDI
ncbi:hypothetical protein ACFLSA_03265 [Bacteroidota bacterium]